MNMGLMRRMRAGASGCGSENPFVVALSDPTEVDLLERQTSEARARLGKALYVLAVAAPREVAVASLELIRALFVVAYLARRAIRSQRLEARFLEGRCDDCSVFGVERTALELSRVLGKVLDGRVGRLLGEPLLMRLFGARKIGRGYRERYVLAVGRRVAGGTSVAGCLRKEKRVVRLFCVLGRSESLWGCGLSGGASSARRPTGDCPLTSASHQRLQRGRRLPDVHPSCILAQTPGTP